MRLFALLAFLASLLLALPALACAEAQMAGLWRASLYGSQLSATIEQDGNSVKGEVVVCALTGETNVYHVVGAVFNGHVYMIHGSGHVFEGDARGNELTGTLTTKGGRKVELRATRTP
ncbi:hypothetical protein GTA51_12525 [Desulfovibrio aerotolerans]|uniref:DUF2147 domain-containing protein n=1 Tax=Solidesulfovibrio aerotolerans TaxID=295255 RepID=A0A7C9MVX4_9BACT|nr:hypothetical protein [Solidesulfovibrio aerotolerans]MYL83954.1 hypothetical protein [Solidesulfovibrio aerotolerans]